MKEFFEIRRAQNGYVIFEDSIHNNPTRSKPFVFETLDGALKFLKEQFEGIAPKNNNEDERYE